MDNHANSPNFKSGQYGGNELPWWRFALSECSCLPLGGCFLHVSTDQLQLSFLKNNFIYQTTGKQFVKSFPQPSDQKEMVFINETDTRYLTIHPANSYMDLVVLPNS